MNKISNILDTFPELSLEKGNLHDEVLYIQSDSRKIQPGDIFCLYESLKPESKDQFLQDALARGASAVLYSSGNFSSLMDKFPNVIHSKEFVSKYHGKLASHLKNNPSHFLKIIAVTGTNGKTSLTNILFQLLRSAGKNPGLIGTISVQYNDKVFDTGYTTPDPSSLQEILSDMKESGVDFVCMEASSHGLKLGRMEGVLLDCGVFTNLTVDHLDFHPNMEDYLLSKFHMYELLNFSNKKNRIGVLSFDSPGGDQMFDLITKMKPNYPIIRFGKKGEYSGKLERLTLQNTEFSFSRGNLEPEILSTNLLGDFNYFNVSLALVTILELFPETSLSSWKEKIQNLQPISGRFEIISPPSRDRIAVVDYAHTPDALENVLSSLKKIPHSRLITVFGCGGDRDRKKRPMMAEIAARFSDHVILTSDNPRTENPEFILEEIQKGIPGNFLNWEKITDRRLAIQKAVDLLEESGLLLVAGKGHENYQIIGTEKFPFSDQEEIRSAFANKKKW